MARLAVLFLLSVCIIGYSDSALRFANYYGNHMVLQMAPKHAQIWGYADTIGDVVTVSLNGATVANVTVHARTDAGSGGVWKALLPPQHAGVHATLRIHSHDGNATLTDVLFGDVWVCSGQSNMVFKMGQVFNHSQELQESAHFANIRIMRVTQTTSNVTLAEPAITTAWQMPKNDAPTSQFSAVCLLYAMNLSPHIHHPIGLVDTAWGGTPVESWMSPHALTTCQHRLKRASNPKQHSVLWNAMVYPILKMTIYGAIWYQGEANSRHSDDYACLFPAMIDDWRHTFSIASGGQTSNMFPFGFVQLAPNKNRTMPSGFPDLRWAQTAKYGYVPNTRMQSVFMAVAMDLPDFSSPFGSIHPRDKLDVAERLALAARAVAYGETNLNYQGPIPSKYTLNAQTLRIEFDHGNSAIEVRDNGGFEVCCGHTANFTCQPHTWSNSTIVQHDDTSVTLDVSACHGWRHVVTAVRYAWQESPCDFKMCPIYGRDNDLPASGFRKDGPF